MLLTDEELEMLWARYANTAEHGKRRAAYGNAVIDSVLQKLAGVSVEPVAWLHFDDYKLAHWFSSRLDAMYLLKYVIYEKLKYNLYVLNKKEK